MKAFYLYRSSDTLSDLLFVIAPGARVYVFFVYAAAILSAASFPAARVYVFFAYASSTCF